MLFDILETAVFTYKQIIPNTNDTRLINRLFLKCPLNRNKVIVPILLDISSKFSFTSSFLKSYLDKFWVLTFMNIQSSYHTIPDCYILLCICIYCLWSHLPSLFIQQFFSISTCIFLCFLLNVNERFLIP